MSAAREAILGRLPAAPPAAASPPVAVARPPATTRRARFAAAARSASATVAEVRTAADVPHAVVAYLSAQGLRPEVWLGADPPGFDAPPAGLRIASGPLPADGATLVTGCLALLAEEGAVVLASGPRHAPEAAFLAATHVVVAPVERLLDGLADLWPLLHGNGGPPRMLNIVRGPSRTADLGVPSRLGAHGPLRVHVVLVGEDVG